MDVFKTIPLGDHQFKIIRDADPMSPREDDNLGTMACFHSNYQLGDKHEEIWKNDREQTWQNAQEFKKWIGEEKDAGRVIGLPLHLYDHSGITMRTKPFHCPWDSGQVGWIYVTKERVIEEYGNFSEASQATALRCLQGEVETYDQYLMGDIYGFILEGPVCDHECSCDVQREQVDSCWGFYGSDPLENGMADGLSDEHRELLKAGA